MADPEAGGGASQQRRCRFDDRYVCSGTMALRLRGADCLAGASGHGVFVVRLLRGWGVADFMRLYPFSGAPA